MKKNVMMRIASFLMVAVLLSTCAISGTFAKYVSTGYTVASARVAKWGVTITGGNTMFSDSYKDSATTYTASENTDAITVQAYNPGESIVAPGTNGTLANFAITGTPEVDVKVTYAATLTLTNWEIAGVDYCPIVFTVGTTDFKIDGITINNIAELKAAVEGAIADVTNTYHTNTDLSAANDDLTVKWSWAIDVDNAKDTVLGDRAVTGSAPNIELRIDVTITQLD